MVDDQPVVAREPYVDLRTVDADRIGLGKRRERILGRARGGPVTAVGDDFGLGGGRPCGEEQGGGNDKSSFHIVDVFGLILVKRNLYKGNEYFRNYNPKPRSGDPFSSQCHFGAGTPFSGPGTAE